MPIIDSNKVINDNGPSLCEDPIISSEVTQTQNGNTAWSHSLEAPSFMSLDMNTCPVVITETKKHATVARMWGEIERGVAGDHQNRKGPSLEGHKGR